MRAVGDRLRRVWQNVRATDFVQYVALQEPDPNFLRAMPKIHEALKEGAEAAQILRAIFSPLDNFNLAPALRHTASSIPSTMPLQDRREILDVVTEFSERLDPEYRGYVRQRVAREYPLQPV